MMKTKEKTQLDRFKKAARELGCDEDETRFDNTVKKLAKARTKSLTSEKSAQARCK